MTQINVLCVDKKTVYHQIPALVLWDKDKDAYNFSGSSPVITHAPCQQWSMLKHFAHNNPKEKELAWFCLEKVRANGGVFEHPFGSSFFKSAGITPSITVDQSWWGFRARKRTWLHFVGFHPCELPAIDLRPVPVTTVQNMDKTERSSMTLSFAQWLVKSVSL